MMRTQQDTPYMMDQIVLYVQALVIMVIMTAVLALTQARYTYGILKTLAYGKVLYHVAVDK
jgi:hypothetical protein